MRMWMVPVWCMCDKHLRGEHVELHMLVGTINAGKSLTGYVERGLIDTRLINQRHRCVARELAHRAGVPPADHKSPLPEYNVEPMGEVDVQRNMRELARRCPECRKGIAKLIDVSNITGGGDRVYQSRGKWYVQLSGLVMPGQHATRQKAVSELERLRRELTE